MPRRRTATAVSTGVIALALVAGCSAGAPGTAAPVATPQVGNTAQAPDPLGLLEAATGATVRAGTARVEMVMDVQLAGRSVPMTVVGGYDFERDMAHLEMDGSAMGLPGTVEGIVTGTSTYLRVPGRPGWYSAPNQAQLASLDVRQQFDALRTAARDARIVGEEDVRGEAMRHLSLTVDLSAVAAQTGTPAAAVGPQEVDLWIDGQDRIRKMQMRVSSGVQAAAVTAELSEFGVPVPVQVPDPAVVQQLPVR